MTNRGKTKRVMRNRSKSKRRMKKRRRGTKVQSEDGVTESNEESRRGMTYRGKTKRRM